MAIQDYPMCSPISNAPADRLIANARARIGERPPRINVTGAPYFRAIPQVPRQGPCQVPHQVPRLVPRLVAQAPTVAPTVARPVTTMVNYQPSALRTRSNQYNLSATKMKNINIRIGSLNEIFLEVYGIAEDLPMMLAKNMYFEPGNPPKKRRLPNSEKGFEVTFTRMLRGAKEEHTRFARLGLVSVPRSGGSGSVLRRIPDVFYTSTSAVQFKENGINVDH
ncbi:hypothetical protein T492DRAFT_840409 [Pavlovales sp. CCMP2436]|nr:hypothetical protein T492DRAFT_840409 [Pavlovales sp. CCMP2436]